MNLGIRTRKRGGVHSNRTRGTRSAPRDTFWWCQSPKGNKFFPANNSRRAPRAEMTEIWNSVVSIKILQFLSFLGKCTNVKLNQKWSWFSARRRVPEPCAESGRRSRNGRGGVPFHFVDFGIPDGRLRGRSIMCLLLSNRWYVQK